MFCAKQKLDILFLIKVRKIFIQEFFFNLKAYFKSFSYLRDVLSYSMLNQSGSLVLPLPDPRGRHYLQFFSGWKLLLKFNVHLLLQLPKVV